MGIYWSACFLSMGLCYILTRSKQYYDNKKNILLTIFCSLPLFLLSALRVGIGTDYNEYVFMYNHYIRNGFRGEIEPIFYYLNRFLLHFDLDAQWLIAVCSALYVFSVIYFILQESKHQVMSVYLLVAMTYYMSSFNTVRQNLGAAICLLSILPLKNNKKLLATLFVIIATGFHYTSCIFLVMIFFNKMKFKPRKTMLFMGIYAISIPALTKVIILIVSNTKYFKYVVGSNTSFSVTSLLGIMLQLCILIFASVYYDENDEEYVLFYNMQLLATCITMLSSSVHLVGRVKWIFALPGIVFIPLILTKVKDQRTRSFYFIGLAVLFFIYAQIVVGMNGAYGVIPYVSVFD